MPSNRKRKNKNRNTKNKKKPNQKKSSQVSEFFEIFLELNNAFLPSNSTGKINLKGYFRKDTYQKVRVIPTKFLRFWEISQDSDSVSDEEISLKFVEFMEELRPNQVPDFIPMVLLDEHQFEFDSKCFFFLNI
jgi:hypothetical protein